MAEDPTSVGEHNLFGFKYTIPEEDNPSEAIITAAGEDTTIEYTFSNGSQSATLNVDKNQSGIDPDVYFGTQLDKFEYVADNYLEKDPVTPFTTDPQSKMADPKITDPEVTDPQIDRMQKIANIKKER